MPETTPVRVLVADDPSDIVAATCGSPPMLGMSRSALYRRLQHYGLKE